MSICPVCRKQFPPAEKFCAQDGAELLPEREEPSADARIGTLIGNYRILEKLGEGGMGTVYRAEHPGLGRFAAVKLLRPEYAQDTEIVLRFFDEARAVNKIRHKHILDVFDLGRTPEGVAYLIAELLIGEDLDRRLKKVKQLPIEEVCAVLSQTCDALQAAHGAGIVHRDLKPENIFLAEQDGQKDFVKVVDFGIAKLLQSSEGLSRTKTGIVMGTPHYMSPEQATGNKLLDGRSDLYSLGIILYECLSGQTPFRGDTMAGVVMQHVLEKPPPLRKMASPDRNIPEELVSLTMRLLEKDPAQRPSSANEVKAILRKYGGTPTNNELPATSGPISTPAPIESGFEKTLKKSLNTARQFWEGLPSQQRWAAGGVALFLLILFLLPSSSSTDTQATASPQVSPLFQAKSNLPQVCDELFAMACDCEAVRVSNCENIKNKINGFEAKMVSEKTPAKEIAKQLEASCKETKKSLEPIRKQYCSN